MKRLFIFLIVITVALTMVMTGCSSSDNEKQLKSYQDEISKLRQENEELNLFKDRFSFSLTKIENTLVNIKNEGYLPFVGSQVNAPELIGAMKEIKSIPVETKNDELILSIMPQEWSEDFNTILVVYDVYKQVLNMSDENAGKISTMAGIFKKTDGKWQLIKFTREFKGDESFSIKGI